MDYPWVMGAQHHNSVRSNFGCTLEECFMNADLHEFLNRLHAEGVQHDAGQTDRTRRYRNLDPETAHFIAIQILLMDAKSVVEIGTSNGYSTIWLANTVASTGGRLATVDTALQDAATENVGRARLASAVDFIRGDAGDYLADLDDGSVDVLFLDAERTQYAGWWPHPYRVLRTGGLMLVDNAHHPAPDELATFVELVAAEPRLDHLIMPIGSGLILARKT